MNFAITTIHSKLAMRGFFVRRDTNSAIDANKITMTEFSITHSIQFG